MKHKFIFIGFMFSALLFLNGFAQQDNSLILKGPYLGQKPPGMTPEIFAPGILNTKKMGAFCSVFSPDGNEFYFVYYERDNDNSGGMAWMKRINDVWTKPEMLHFNSTVSDNDMCMSLDGNKLIFRSWRALPDGKKPKDHSYLWFVERTEDGWSHAKPLYCGDVPVRTGYPSLAANGTLYCAHRNVEVFGIYRAKPVNGAYVIPEHVFTAIDSIDTEGDMFVAPDESYMIISCWDHPDNIGSGQGDLYITFHKDDGTWTEEINMGELINTQYGENCPQVSPDGNYFFFNRYNPDAKEGNIYWVDAKIIEELRPMDDFSVLKGPYLGQTPPGSEPEIFAPGLITTHYSQSYIAFLNEARVCVYSAGTEKGHETYFTYEKNGNWTAPQRAPFEELQGHPNYTTGPHGRNVYFHSGRPTHPDDSRQDDNIWTIEWTGSDWAEPEVLPPPANSDYGEAYPSAASDGTVYFFTWRRPGTRGDDIWTSRCIDKHYQEAERLPWPINTDFIEYDPYVAPDESFLIFGSTRPSGYGNSDNYICFRKEDGNWTHPINLGLPLNSSSYDLCANGTPDGNYFFFLSGRKTDVDKGLIGKKSGEEPEEDSDLYWVDFSFINDLKNTMLTKQNAADIIKQDYDKNGVQSAVDTLNKLYSNQKDDMRFSPFEFLSLCKNMIVEEKTGDADLFFSSLDEVLPKDFSIKEGYARFCVMNGRVSKGLNILEELKSEDPNFDLSDSLSGLGYLFTLYPDKTENALSVLQFTIEKFPEDPFVYYSLARVYRQLGDLDNAIANCRKALEIRPSIGDVSQLLERLLKEREEKKESVPVLKGPYLGQKPPGMKPEVFAPGFFLEDKNWFNVIFSPDGNELYFVTDFDSNRSADIMWLRNMDGIWTDPEPVSFNSKFNDLNMCLSADGNRFFFRSKRPIPGSEMPSVERHYLWFTTRTKEGWSDPQLVEYSGFETITTAYQSITNDGTLYFATPGSVGDLDIHCSRFVGGSYSLPENLGCPPNTEYSEADMFIAKDEGFIIASCWNRPDNNGESDLYISFHKNDGSWTKLINMSKPINNELNENCPMISPDGKYFFFLRYNPTIEKAVTYWVSAKIIEDFKPKELK